MRPAAPGTGSILRYGDVARRLRRRIVEGDWSLGARLPTRMELQRQMGTTAATLQKALDQLAADGFVKARGRAGTFVTPRPPHTTTVGLVFRGQPHTSGMWHALEQEARRLMREGQRQFRFYESVDPLGHPGSAAPLIDDVEHERLAGVIFANPAFGMEGTPVMTHPRLARVAITYPAKAFGLPIINFGDLLPHALAAVKRLGRRRVALFSSLWRSVPADGWLRAAADAGLVTTPQWLLPIHPDASRTARPVARLLMSLPANRRPNAIFIDDDSLVEQATAGLLDAGVRVPDDLVVVAHCNFPWPPPSMVPVTRIGYDIRQLLGRLLGCIDDQCAGRDVPAVSILEPTIEAEPDDLTSHVAQRRGAGRELPIPSMSLQETVR